MSNATKAFIERYLKEKTNELEILLKEGKIKAFTNPEWKGNEVWYTITPKDPITFLNIKDCIIVPD